LRDDGCTSPALVCELEPLPIATGCAWNHNAMLHVLSIVQTGISGKHVFCHTQHM